MGWLNMGWLSIDWLRLESPAYWITFVASFLLVAILESVRPNRECMIPSARRWTMHGLLLTILSVVNTVVFQLSPVAAAVSAQGSGWGVLGFSAIPYPVRFGLTILLLDFTKYGTHWLYHHVGFLWPIHRVHHSDPDFDVSTGARFHPLEPLLAQAVDLGLILLLAPPPSAVLVAKLLSVASNFWEHANASLPGALERTLRRWIVTPDLHRIHHSQGLVEQNRNFGEVFPWWDKLFGTYHGELRGHFEIGLRGYRNSRSMELGEMLLQPFRPERK